MGHAERWQLSERLLAEARSEIARLRVLRGSTPRRTARRTKRVTTLIALAAAVLGVPAGQVARAARTTAFAAGSTNPFGLTDIGFNATPALADIDSDGDLDVFFGRDVGHTSFFENTGSAVAPAFSPSSSNPFGLADAGSFSSPTFADIDGDGDLDALIGESLGRVIFFDNTGTAVAPAFAAPTTGPFGLGSVGTMSSPEFADIDGDGDLDAHFGQYLGNTISFENTGSVTAPAFATASTNAFGLTDVGSSSSPELADVDDDGDLDALIGSVAGDVAFFRNTGTATAPVFVAASTNPFGLSDVGAYSSPALGDINGDGDLDAFVGQSLGNTAFFANTGTATPSTFAAASTNPFGFTDAGYRSKPEFADIDGDGDFDAFVGVQSGATFFANTGSATAPAFAAPTPYPFGWAGAGDHAPSLVDIDADGDLDVLLGRDAGDVVFFDNTGTATAPAFVPNYDNPFGLEDVGRWSAPDLVDINGDGRLDIFVGEREGDTIYFPNYGAAVDAFFFLPFTNPNGLANVGYYAAPDLADFDGDGDFDAFLGEYYGTTRFFRNTGTAIAPAFAAPSTDPFGLADVGDHSAPDLVDIDADGDLDAFVGEQDGDIVFFEANAAPSDIGLSDAAIAENQPSGSDVGSLSTTDVDSASHTYTLVAGSGDSDNDSFDITRSTLETTASFDFEADASKTVRVRTDDGAGGTYEEAFTITVTDANDAPTDVALTPATVPENQPSGTDVGTLSTTDPDVGASHTYTLVAGDGSDDNTSFAITGSTLETTAPFDFETDASKTVRIRTDDGAGGTYDEAVTITITDAGDAPTDVTLAPATVPENHPLGTEVGTLSTTDPDATGSHTYALATGDGSQDNDAFAITGSTLETAATFDFETDASKTVRIRTDDGAGGTFEEAFTITVADVAEGFLITDVTQPEGDSGKTSFGFTLTRTGDVSAPARVKVKAIGVTATKDKDFIAIPKKKRTIRFAAGESSKTVTVKVIGDTKIESDETFLVVLSNPTGAVIVDATGTGTITNDDP